MTRRMSVDEAKAYWFGDELTVCAMDGEGEFWGALPRREVKRGHKYLNKLKKCKTIGDAQAVYVQYASDPDAPRLLPSRIINFLDEGDQILEFIESEIQNKPSKFASLGPIHLEKMSNKGLFELVKDEPFDLYESRFYRDESDMNVVYGQPSLITDEWIPLEIAETIGLKDEGEGFFYETVEYVYLDFKEFCRAFSEYGIKVIAKDREIDELTGF